MTETLSTRLRILRRMFGLTASDMAMRVGLKDRKSWENYERGQTTPKADALTQLALMGVNINWLLTSIGTPGPAPTPPQVVKPPLHPDGNTLDATLLARIGEDITLLLQEEGRDLSHWQIASLQAQTYAELVSTYDSDRDRLIGLRLLLRQIRRDLPRLTSGQTTP